MKHTPGPWEYEREFEDAGAPGNHYTRELESVLIVYGDGENDFWRIESISNADARLIAAAPELYAAVQAFQAGFRDGSIRWTKPRRSDSDPYHPANVLACAAIEKAEGR